MIAFINLIVMHTMYIFTQDIYILFINTDSLKGMQKKRNTFYFSPLKDRQTFLDSYCPWITY